VIALLAERDELRARVAARLGAASLDPDTGAMACPRCRGHYGPNDTLEALSVYAETYLPGYPLLVGICMGCELIAAPRASYDPRHQLRRRLGGPVLIPEHTYAPDPADRALPPGAPPAREAR